MTETDIAVLFARDPLKLTKIDIDKIIAGLRERRKNFNLEPEPRQKHTTKAERLIENLDIKVNL